jgi:hypothetical protein
MKYEPKSWLELPSDTPYKNGYTIKVPVMNVSLFDYKQPPAPTSDWTPGYTTYIVTPPPHEMRSVQNMRLIQGAADAPWMKPYSTIQLNNASGPYYLDTRTVRGVWVKKPEPIEIQPGQLIDNGYMTVWWLCNGATCCGGDGKLTEPPTQIKQVEDKPLLALDKAPVSPPQGVTWANPETPQEKLERLLKAADPETRRKAQQILEGASDILLVDGWTKGAYHRDKETNVGTSGET